MRLMNALFLFSSWGVFRIIIFTPFFPYTPRQAVWSEARIKEENKSHRLLERVGCSNTHPGFCIMNLFISGITLTYLGSAFVSKRVPEKRILSASNLFSFLDPFSLSPFIFFFFSFLFLFFLLKIYTYLISKFLSEKDSAH